jgi:hypothetical protein
MQIGSLTGQVERRMNDHTIRVLGRAAAFLKQYRNDEKLSLRWLVRGLEASLDALEEQLPHAFYTAWYRHWGNLEQKLAAGASDTDGGDVAEDVAALEMLLLRCVAGECRNTSADLVLSEVRDTDE